jgi:hypothetical protein
VKAALALVLAVLCVAAVGCRAPGDPPTHPDRAAYQDLIRRELDAAGTALASGSLTLRYADAGRVPGSYERVVLRQAANDLRKVAQDLGQITPPARAATSQKALLEICTRERGRLETLSRNPADGAARSATRAALARDSHTLEKTLTPRLDPS